MAKKKAPDQGEDLNMDMSPMIDCVFLLLIFFIVVSTQAEVPVDPKVKPTIANDSTEQESAKHRIVVNVYPSDDGGDVIYTQEDSKIRMSVDELGDYIKEMKEFKSKGDQSVKCMLHMRADRRLPWKDIQVVAKAAADHGILDVNFASYQENPTP